MSEVIQINVEDGQRMFQFPDAEPFTVDIFLANDRWVDLCTERSNVPGENVMQKYIDFVKELSGQARNAAEALAFVKELAKQVERVKKNIAGSLNSADSTASTASA